MWRAIAKKQGVAGTVLASMLMLAACGSNDSAPSASPSSSAPAGAPPSASQASETPKPIVDLRLDVVATGTQSIPAYVMQKLELDKKHGFNLIINENSGAGGANWTAIKTNMADAIITNWLDVARNRQQTTPVYAVAPFLGWSNGLLVPADSAVKTLADLKGLKLGVYNAKSLDWVMMRAAAQKTAGFDPSEENEVTEGAPGLLLGLMEQKKVDGIVNYGDMNTKMSGTGQYKTLFTTANIMDFLGLNGGTAFLYYGFTETFIEEHPETVEAFVAAYAEAVETLRTDDDVWYDIAKDKFDITDEAGVVNLRFTLRGSIKKELGGTEDADARALFQWIKDSGNEELLGVSELPEKLFWTAGE